MRSTAGTGLKAASVDIMGYTKPDPVYLPHNATTPGAFEGLTATIRRLSA